MWSNLLLSLAQTGGSIFYLKQIAFFLILLILALILLEVVKRRKK